MNLDRRKFLKMGSITGAMIAGTGTGVASAESDAQGSEPRGVLKKMSHLKPSTPEGSDPPSFAESIVRHDGKYGVLGSYTPGTGSFLFDLSDPWNPEQLHHLESPDYAQNVDVKFDRRDGLYYRSEEGQGSPLGVEIVDYGYSDGTPENPKVLSRIDTGASHNVFPHPEEDVLYITNRKVRGEPEPGLEVWDISDPANPEPRGQDAFAPLVTEEKKEYLHDIVVDPKREILHGAFIGGFSADFLDAYVTFDVSDPLNPETLGVFDYDENPDYREVGKEGFQMCHYADYDSERDLAIVGDEKQSGIPGGKHVFDIGWDTGSPSNPKPIGFTHSPNAKRTSSAINWTTHNHDVVNKENADLLVSGDYKEGTVVYDISDPRNPTPSDRYLTDDGIEGTTTASFGGIPFCWGADYTEEGDFAFAADLQSGIYTFKVLDKTFMEYFMGSVDRSLGFGTHFWG